MLSVFCLYNRFFLLWRFSRDLCCGGSSGEVAPCQGARLEIIFLIYRPSRQVKIHWPYVLNKAEIHPNLRATVKFYPYFCRWLEFISSSVKVAPEVSWLPAKVAPQVGHS